MFNFFDEKGRQKHIQEHILNIEQLALIELLLKKKNPNPEIIGSSTEHGNRVEIEMAMDQLPFKVNIPTHIRKEVGKCLYS